MENKIYIQKFINGKEDLPEKKDRYFIHHKKADRLEAVDWLDEEDNDYWLNHVDWYLLPVEIPSEEEIKKACPQELPIRIASWIQGANWLLNKLLGK